MNKKNQKGFSLVELLVVVAIIGALAAVGVVAYNGYTAAAKKNASKSIHSGAVKFIAAELQKCMIDTGDAAIGVDCETAAGVKITAAEVVGAYNTLAQDKNPYDGSDGVLIVASTTPLKGTLYAIATDASTITITMDPSGEATDALSTVLKID